MKNELGIEVCCFNCSVNRSCLNVKKEYEETKLSYDCFRISNERLVERIKELQKQQFTEQEAEKIETFLTHGYQMMINENKKIFSKLEKMKGEQ